MSNCKNIAETNEKEFNNVFDNNYSAVTTNTFSSYANVMMPMAY